MTDQPKEPEPLEVRLNRFYRDRQFFFHNLRWLVAGIVIPQVIVLAVFALSKLPPTVLAILCAVQFIVISCVAGAFIVLQGRHRVIYRLLKEHNPNLTEDEIEYAIFWKHDVEDKDE